MNDSLGDRMKEYEDVNRYTLIHRLPVIMRLDGKAFHTFTRNMERPFDERMMRSMVGATRFLVENVQGCKLAYTQSDEISLLLVNYELVTTQAWFGNNLQKMVSVAASMCTAAFMAEVEAQFEELDEAPGYPFFDARAFVLPKHEVTNYFIWRQKDATRNSIQSVGRSKFSHRTLENVSCNEIQERLFSSCGINWDGLPTWQKRGICVGSSLPGIVDMNIPIFTQDRHYIERFVDFEPRMS